MSIKRQKCTMTAHEKTQHKSREFSVAMDKYSSSKVYPNIGKMMAALIVGMQLVSFIHVLPLFIGERFILTLCLLCLAYLVADFFNGIVHMMMDNCSIYSSALGPFVAAFHMHHKTPRYRNNSLVMVYFLESGSKWWLLFFMAFLTVLQQMYQISSWLSIFLVFFGILSSFSEVSHYLCHNASSKNRFVTFLQKKKILLAKAHHAKHHTEDNVNYCFLNGLADPIVNILAKSLYDGYKNNTDVHAASYMGKQTSNR